MARTFLAKSTDGSRTLRGMPEQITSISRAISDILTGAYMKKRLTQDVIAERANMSIWTLQKKLKARAPITATDLVVLSLAIGVKPADVLQEAILDAEMLDAQAEAQMSEGVTNIADQRRKKRPSEMTEEELDAFEGEQAANRDPELGYDEPEAP
jgi:hypothetical protein